ncbi:MAG: hypothetical protein ACXU7D_03670, partial [Burkholderiaceae bacterium]
MNSPLLDSAIDGQQLKEFFLARQPILNRDQNLIAYELLFRGAAHGAANVIDDLSATALPAVGAGTVEKLVFVVGAGAASLAWQLVIATGGSLLHHRVSPR